MTQGRMKPPLMLTDAIEQWLRIAHKDVDAILRTRNVLAAIEERELRFFITEMEEDIAGRVFYFRVAVISFFEPQPCHEAEKYRQLEQAMAAVLRKAITKRRDPLIRCRCVGQAGEQFCEAFLNVRQAVRPEIGRDAPAHGRHEGA